MFPYIVLVYDGALLVGLLLGRWVKAPPWASPLVPSTILVLVAALGASLAQATSSFDPLIAVLEGVAIAAALIGLTTLAAYLLGARRAPLPPGQRPAHPWRLPLAILASLALGYVSGRLLPGATSATGDVEVISLVAMLVLIGWSLRWVRPAWRQIARPLTEAALGATATAVLVVILTGWTWGEAFAIVVPFGWYSLAGPYLAVQISPAFGLVAFLANFLRENFTMTGAPLLGRAAGPEGLTACGGATAMDTTLYFIEAYGDPDWATTALACGFLLTLAAPLLLALATL